MRASTAIVLAISSFAAAQNLAGQPACASACLSSAITAGGCALTDAACQCGAAQAAIGTIAAPCLLSACTAVTDLVAAQSAGAAACAAYSAMSTAPMAAAATTTSAVATTSSTVTQTNVATTTMTNAASVAAMSSMSAAMGAAMSSLTAAPVVSSVAAMSSMSAALAGAMSSVAGNVTRATTSAPAMATTNAAVGKMVNGGLIAAALGAVALL